MVFFELLLTSGFDAKLKIIGNADNFRTGDKDIANKIGDRIIVEIAKLGVEIGAFGIEINSNIKVGFKELN